MNDFNGYNNSIYYKYLYINLLRHSFIVRQSIEN